MSTIKSPQDKKLASLMKDSRNVYGENDKSSRKNIPRSKQRQHQEERRPMKNALALASKTHDEEEISDLAFSAESKTIEKKRKGFAKRPDASLGDVLSWRKTGKLGTLSNPPAKRRAHDALNKIVRF